MAQALRSNERAPGHSSVLDLKQHFSRTLAAAPGRIHLAAHSHHFQPDVTRDAQLACWDDAARLADRKWGAIFGEVWPAVQRGVAARLNLADAATIAFSPNTHDFLLRILSCLPADRRLSVLSTDGEFHSFTRQMDRLAEAGLVEVTRVPTRPAESFAERFLNAVRGFSGDLVFVSQVFFDSGSVSLALPDLRGALPNDDMFLVVDGYHGFMALPTDLAPVADRAFYLSGGYKYAMAGENVCFLHCPPNYGPRPRSTGWFASFGALSNARADVVPYGDGRHALHRLHLRHERALPPARGVRLARSRAGHGGGDPSTRGRASAPLSRRGVSARAAWTVACGLHHAAG